ncbi:hypothetical protein EKK58_08480 [Candidatus Dependentiae bacterium]|nr:MAG: hypothetical protein EKK58_08480 [Candidatus Dependentiae bacterium]
MNKLETLLKLNKMKITKVAKKNENGPDIWVLKNGVPYSIEVKKCKITKRNSVQVPPVEKNRRNDDFIAIIHPSGYILFEPMKHHLSSCTPKGYRTLWS